MFCHLINKFTVWALQIISENISTFSWDLHKEEVLRPHCETHLCAQTGSSTHTPTCTHNSDSHKCFGDRRTFRWTLTYFSLLVLRCWFQRVWGNTPGTPSLCQRPNTKSQMPVRWLSMRWTAPPVTCWTGVWIMVTRGERGASARTHILETAASVTTATRSRTWLWNARRT